MAVLSAPVRELMFAPEEDAVGETVAIAGRPFTVVGAYAPHTIYNTRLYRDERGFVDSSVWLPASILEYWPTPQSRGVGIEVRVHDPALASGRPRTFKTCSIAVTGRGRRWLGRMS